PAVLGVMCFKGGNEESLPGLGGERVQEADRVEVIGAVGTARAVADAGAQGELIYEPHLHHRKRMTYEEYRNGTRGGDNHVDEKLLKLKDGMNTKSGKKLAEERHQFMVKYLEQFFAEQGM